MDVDPNGPCPMEYHAAQEWHARRAGVPPLTTTSMFGTTYNIPTNYHERQALFEKYRQHREDFLKGKRS